MILIYLLLSLNGGNSAEFSRLVKTYLRHPDRKLENIIIEKYREIRPDGLVNYIKFLKKKDDDEGIKKEILYWIDYLKDADAVLDTHGEKWILDIHRKLTDSFINIRNRPYYFNLLSRYVPVLELYLNKLHYKNRPTRIVLPMYMRRLRSTLEREVSTDTLYKYRQGLMPLIRGMRDKYEYIKNREKEEEKRALLFNMLQKGDYEKAMEMANTDYEKGIALVLSGKTEEGKTYIKRAILNDSLKLLPVYICMNTDEKDARFLLQYMLMGREYRLEGEPGITLYNILNQGMIVQPLDTFLIPYSLYFEAVRNRKQKEIILKKYPFTSPAFILRSKGK